MKRKILLLCAAVLTVSLCACGARNQAGNEPGTASSSKPGPGTAPSEPEGTTGSVKEPDSKETDASKAGELQGPGASDRKLVIRALEDLDFGPELLTRSYFKAGDIRYRATFSPTGNIRYRLTLSPSGGMAAAEGLLCSFSIPDETSPGEIEDRLSAAIATEQGKKTYEINPGIYEEETSEKDPTYRITFVPDGNTPHILIEGEGKLAGDYYDPEVSFLRPDLFTRCLCAADLYGCSTEDLGLLRNEVFAAHGRMFEADQLKKYFEERPWYLGRTAPGDFSDSVLSDVEKKNVELIRKLEETDFSERNQVGGLDYAAEWDKLLDAPYLSFLDQNKEIAMTADLSQSKDMGVYEVVQGTVSLPASVSPEELATVEDGGEVKVTLDALEKSVYLLTLAPSEERQSDRYLLYPENADPKETGIGAEVRLNYETGQYELWQMSDDTIFNTAYRGDLYFLKGAVEGAHVSLVPASEEQKKIRPEDGSGDSAQTVSGNRLYHNGKGYFTAVYWLGD